MSAQKEAVFTMRLLDMISGPMKGISEVAGSTTKRLNEATGAAARLGDGGGVFGKLKSSISSLPKGLSEAANEVPGLNQALSMVSNPYVAITAGVAATGAALAVATGKAMDFERGMAKINTTAQMTKTELDGLRSMLLTMGADSTVPLAEVPDAFNQILSAVGNTKDALSVFAPALKASQGGFVDVRTAGEAAVNVMGAAGLKASEATEVFDTLFASVRLGKGEFKDFAQYLPKILPLSQNVGFSYKEVAGAFALLTAKGQTAEQSTMLLQNAMNALSKSEVIFGTKSKKGFERSGIAIFDNAGKMRKLVDIMGDVNKRTTGLTDKQRQAFLSGLGLDQEAASAFAQLSKHSKLLREFVKGTTDSAGEMEGAYKRSLNPADRQKILLNQWELAMTNIGYKILPYVNEGLKWGLDFVNGIKDNSEHIGNYFATAVAPIRLMWSGLKGVWNVATWLSDLTGGSTGSLIESMFGGSGKVWGEIRTFLTDFFAYINVSLQAIDDVAEGHFKRASQRFDEFNNMKDVRLRGGYVGEEGTGPRVSIGEFFGLATKRDDDKKTDDTNPLTLALDEQNKGLNEGDNSKSRIVNTRIDKIEVIVKVANAAGQNLQEIGKQVASVIVGSIRDSEIIVGMNY